MANFGNVILILRRGGNGILLKQLWIRRVQRPHYQGPLYQEK